MTCELYRFDKNLNRTNSKHSSSDANIFINEMTFNHAHWKDLIEIIKSQNDNSLIIEPINIQPNIVKSQRYTFYHVIWVFINVLQELFDIRVTAAVKIRVVHIYNNIFKIVFFLFPFEVLLELWKTEGFKENLNTEMFEVVGL